MSEAPWLTIVGLGEDGLKGLGPASRSALESAEIVMGPPRHLALLGDIGCNTITWPVPFAEGIDRLLDLRGRRVVVLASGDPFWYGAGATLARHLKRTEWVSHPAASTFSRAASLLGWPLETTRCIGLHAAPFTRLRPELAQSARMIILVRDGSAVRDLATYLTDAGYGASLCAVLEALGGPGQRVTHAQADTMPDSAFQHPVCVAVEIAGDGPGLPLASGRPDHWFDNDGQITKRPVRAMTLSALAPRPFEHLWDIGGGSGSIGIEWLLTHPSLSATTVEPRPDRAQRVRDNASRLGVDRLNVVTGYAPDALHSLPAPNVVFVGGGLSAGMLDWLESHLATGTRVVANAVTLETEALLITTQARLGGDLLRLELSRPEPLGPRQGWKAGYPIVQWSVTL
ncbi:precorrin-6y C5,15-methyltransferase (decarboxylating) subunit CbiE [Roseobacter sp. YSTF-M11]|uniref:Precorrin-6y C5,15-methyltransferase (Decarboxylating) subunit CbiE n=1 Tax=Roseobacter insulae TaxID=2859783 RepID=A0A9X1FY04_9RHOB|nr:precorrin-6y C5,15-methyltransferase (decarboxylating) subunit CbiE [Roseobacter insulae]MBW4709105.1 precorrin-6y C5,15-methyltransferase (decarboxylating) subunit CbiE [Roseobacter insulae]